MKRKLIIQPPSASQYEVPSYLKTAWTSCDPAEFTKVLENLQKGVDKNSKSHILGFRETFLSLEKDSLNIFCVVACIGQNCGQTSRLATRCFEAGVPLILGRGTGRGAHDLGRVFGKGRVCCVALLKAATLAPDLMDFVMKLSSCASQTQPALRDSEDIKERFLASIGRKESLSKPTKLKVQNLKKNRTNFPPKNNFSSSFE